MRYFSTFSGIGGFELGIQQAYEKTTHNQPEATELHAERDMRGNNSNELQRTAPCCMGFSEIDKYATQIYQKHFAEHKPYGDITKINTDELPDFDLLVGGFPCQAFSIAGKRRGFEDTRGTMFFELARILRAKKPRLFVFENVKGLLSHDNGQTFRTIISTLDELGYDLQWQVLNSKNFGVPQNRERVFIVGHLRGTRRPEVFPFGVPTKNSIEQGGNYTNRLATASGQIMEMANQTKPMSESSNLTNPNTATTESMEQGGVSPTLNTAQGGNRQPFIADEWKIRRLTPTECERLQGFPDGWTDIVSDTQRYKCLGNAVTVNVVQAIMEKLLT